MNTLFSKSTSRFSVNVPQSVLFSDNLVSLSNQQTRFEEIELALESIFGVESHLTTLQTIKVHNMQREIDKIKQRYVGTERVMIALDALRINHFEERIEEIYMENKPSQEEFLYAESLMQEQEELFSIL